MYCTNVHFKYNVVIMISLIAFEVTATFFEDFFGLLFEYNSKVSISFFTVFYYHYSLYPLKERNLENEISAFLCV